MTFQDPNDPFLRLKARGLLLRGVLISLGIGIVFVLLASMAKLNLNDAVIAPILYMLLFGLLCLWIFRQFDRLRLNRRLLVGRVSQNQKWLPAIGLVVALLMFSLGAFQVSFSLLALLAPSFVEAVLKASALSAKPITAVPVLYGILNTVALVIVAPVVEEFIFRGVLFQRWAVKWGIQPALLVSAVVFGILHANVIGLSVFGLVMGLLYIQSRTLIVPIVCHALNNSLALGFGWLSSRSTSIDTLNLLEQLQSNWWVGVLLLVLSGPWIVRFILRNFPRSDTPIPYVANASRVRWKRS